MLETERAHDEAIQGIAIDDRSGVKYLYIVTHFPDGTRKSIQYNTWGQTALSAVHTMDPSCDQVLNLLYNTLFCCHYTFNKNCTVYRYFIDQVEILNLVGQAAMEVGGMGDFDWITIVHQRSDLHLKGSIYQTSDHSINAWYATSMEDHTFYCQLPHYVTNGHLKTTYLDGDNMHKYMILMELDGATLSAHVCDMTSNTGIATKPWTNIDIIHKDHSALNTDMSWTPQASNARLSTYCGGHTHRVILAVQSTKDDGSISSFLIWYQLDITGRFNAITKFYFFEDNYKVTT